MDIAAEKLGIDRVEIRRRNLIGVDDMPFKIKFNEPGLETLVFDLVIMSLCWTKH